MMDRNRPTRTLPGFRLRPLLRGAMRMLAADTGQHGGGVTTNAMWAMAVFATNTMARLVARNRRVLRQGTAALRGVTVRAATAHRLLEEAERRHESLTSTAEARRVRLASVDRRLFDVRIPRGIAVALAVVTIGGDYAFMFTTYAQIWSVSFSRLAAALSSPSGLGEFLVNDLSPLIGSLLMAVLVPLVSIALSVSAGKQLAALRDGTVHGSEVRADGVSWGLGRVPTVTLGLQVAMLMLIALWFGFVGFGRISGDAEDAGLQVPGALLALMFALLPIATLLAETLSRSPLRDADERDEREHEANMREESDLRASIEQAELRLGEAWTDLAMRVARIVDEANLAIALLEQIFAHAFFVTGAVGSQAPIRVAETTDEELRRLAAQLDRTAPDQPALPRVEQVRGLAMPIPQWLVEELTIAVQSLAMHRPVDWTSPQAAARRILDLRRAGTASEAVPHRAESSEV